MVLCENSDQIYIRDEFENFICPECGLKFVTSVEVDQHLRQHTGEDLGYLGYGENSFKSNEEFSNADTSDNSKITGEVLKEVHQHETPTEGDNIFLQPIQDERKVEQPIRKERGVEKPIGNKRSTQPFGIGNERRSVKPIGNERTEQPFCIRNIRRSEKPIGNERMEQPFCIRNIRRSEKPISNGSNVLQPSENQRTWELNIEDTRSVIQLIENQNVPSENQRTVLHDIDNENVPQKRIHNHRNVLRPIENGYFMQHSENEIIDKRLIKSDNFEQQPIKDEYSNQPIKTEHHEPYVNGNVYEYIVKRESDLPVDYEIPMDLIEHLRTTPSDDQTNIHCLESQNHASECMEDNRHGILHQESTDNHQPIQELNITNVQNSGVHGPKQDSMDLGVSFQMTADSIDNGYIQAVAESGDSSILCSPVIKSVVSQPNEQQTTHSYSGTSSQQINLLTEIPKETALQIPEEFSSSMNIQNPTYEQSPEISSTGPPADVSELDTTPLRLDHVPPEAAIDDPNQDDPTNDLPVLERFSPLKNKIDSFPSMPHLEPVLPLNHQHEESKSEESLQKTQELAKGARIGQVKEQVNSKYRKTRQFVCESFHCYRAFFSNAGLQKHMIKFHPGYVPVSARIFQAPRPKSKSNKPKTVKRVHFSEKNQIHIIEPIFNLPHGVKNGKYVCLKCKGVFEDTFDLREHLKKFKNKLHCDKIQRSKKKGKRKLQNKVNVQENPRISGCIQKASGLLDAASEPTVESNLQEMDTNECASDATDPIMDTTNFPNTNSEDSELFLSTNSNIISDKGKKTFACMKCSKTFFYKKTLKNHLKAHTDADYRCEFCPNTFSTKKNLNEHSNSEHKDEFQCLICHTKYAYKSYFRNHMKKKHNRDIPTYLNPNRDIISTNPMQS